MRFGSLFTGIGGIDLGLERAGMSCVFQVEFDDFAQKVLRKHWPDVPRFGDIRGIDCFPDCDVLAGGFPCQDVSQARHNGLGVKGEKSGLWSEFKRAIAQVRPAYVIVENVSALRFAGRGLDRVLRDLAHLGYDAEWCVFRASDVGAPHHRARLWLVAYPNSNSKPDVCVYDEARFMSQLGGDGWSWPDPPRNLRVDDGVSTGLDGRKRLKALGNAVVPLAAQVVGEAVMRHHRA